MLLERKKITMMRLHTIKIGLMTSCLWLNVAIAAGVPDVVNTPATKTHLASVKPLSALAKADKRFVAVGQRGHIIYSDNQGESWQQATVPVSSDLTAVYFVSANKGWAVGHDGVVLMTADKGVTWQKQLDGWQVIEILKKQAKELTASATQPDLVLELERFAEQGADKPFLDVWFKNEKTGFIVGAFGLIFQTNDGGQTWQSLMHQAENKGFLHLYAVQGHGDSVFVAGEQGTILKQSAGSSAFVALNSPYKGSFFGLLSAPDVLLAYGLRGNLVRSTDNGTTWRQIDTYLPSGLVDGAVLDNGQMILVSQRGEILLSKNQGVSFYRPTGNQRTPFTSVVPVSNKRVLISGLVGVRAEDLK